MASGDYLFFALAGICQVVVGLIFMVRSARREWARAAGMLFLLNGALSFGSMLIAMDRTDAAVTAARNMGYLLDPITSYIILYLALAYPTPVANRKWLALAIGLGAAAQLSTGLFQDGLLEKLYRGHNLGGMQAMMYVSFVQEVAWTAILVRWSRAMARPGVDWRFALLACAIAVRASHVSVVSFGTRLNKLNHLIGDFADLSAPYHWQLFMSALPVLAIFYALFVLLAPRSNMQRNTPAEIYIAFLLFGIMEALLSMASLTDAEWIKAPFLYADALVMRPILVWGSLYALPQTKWGTWAGIGTFVVLCVAAFVPTGSSMFREMQVENNTAMVFSFLFAGAVLALAIRFLFPLLREETWEPLKRPLP